MDDQKFEALIKSKYEMWLKYYTLKGFPYAAAKKRAISQVLKFQEQLKLELSMYNLLPKEMPKHDLTRLDKFYFDEFVTKGDKK